MPTAEPDRPPMPRPTDCVQDPCEAVPRDAVRSGCPADVHPCRRSRSNPSRRRSSANSNSNWSSQPGPTTDCSSWAARRDGDDVRELPDQLLHHRRPARPGRLTCESVNSSWVKPNDAAAQRVHHVVGEVDGESAGAEHLDHRVQVRQHDRRRHGPGLDDAARPRVSQERPARRQDALPDRALPVGVRRRRIDLADDDVDHAVEQFVLVRDVLVQRHRDDAELLARGCAC